MHKLSILDASFLYFESDHMPMNIGAVEHFQVPPERREGFYQELLRYLADVVDCVPFMREKLKATPLGMDQPVWIPDPDFDLTDHIERIQLDPPGSLGQLEERVAELHEHPLDRRKPLWKYFWIEGLEDGNCALYSKYHHACMDGMGAQLILNTTLSDSPERFPAHKKLSLTEEASRPRGLALLQDAATNFLRKPLDSNHPLREQLASARKLSRRLLSGAQGLGAFVANAPRTPFNRAISSKRSWACCSIPLAEMKRIGQAQGASVNDVLMTVVAGALRRYLIREGALPGRSLIAGVPVSLRSSDDSTTSNRVTMLLCARYPGKRSFEAHGTDPRIHAHGQRPAG